MQLQTEKSSGKERVFFNFYYTAVFWKVIVRFVVLNKNLKNTFIFEEIGMGALH